MAGSKLTSRVKSSTILEVVVSMVIIVAVFGIAMMIYTNVLRSSISQKKIQAEALLQDVMINIGKNPTNTDQTFNIDGFRIEQTVKIYEGNIFLKKVYLVAYDQNQQKVAELQKVIFQ